MLAYNTAQRNELIPCEQGITSFGGALRRPSLETPPFCEETGAKSTEIGLR